jgi:hypothetical protein
MRDVTQADDRLVPTAPEPTLAPATPVPNAALPDAARAPAPAPPASCVLASSLPERPTYRECTHRAATGIRDLPHEHSRYARHYAALTCSEIPSVALLGPYHRDDCTDGLLTAFLSRSRRPELPAKEA